MKAYTSQDFSNVHIKVNWAVEKLIPCHGIGLVYADAKVGKSILMMQLCKALSEGRPFLGFNTTKMSKVMYVQADETAPEWAEQIKMTGLGNQIWETALVDPGCLMDPAKTDDLKRGLYGYDFAVFDSLISLFAGLNTNSTMAMTTAMVRLRSVFNNPCMLIHHKTKGAQGIPRNSYTSAAGNFAIGAQTSTMYDLEPSQLHARGRVVNQTLPLQRTGAGLWEVDKTAQQLNNGGGPWTII